MTLFDSFVPTLQKMSPRKEFQIQVVDYTVDGHWKTVCRLSDSATKEQIDAEIEDLFNDRGTQPIRVMVVEYRMAGYTWMDT